MSSFADFRPQMRRVRAAVRPVIPHSGCELAAALLTRQLRREGVPASFVRGHYLAPGEERNAKNLHAWVEAEGLLLDPTRDQYGEDPFSETYEREYIHDGGDPPVDLDRHIYGMLNMQLSRREAAVRALVEQYELDISQLELPPTLSGPSRSHRLIR